jgi:hypothetical protein
MANRYAYAYRDDLKTIIAHYNRGTFTRLDLEQHGIGMSKIKKMSARELIVSKGEHIIRERNESRNLTLWSVPVGVIKMVERYEN